MSASPFGRKRIGVFPESALQAENRLLDSLADVFPLDFVPGGDATYGRLDAALFFSEEGVSAKQAFERGVSSFLFDSRSRRAGLKAGSTVEFSNSSWLHPAFRSARIPIGCATAAGELMASGETSTLASCEALKLWTRCSLGAAELHATALEPPHLRDGQLLCSCLQPGNWMGLLPLLHFLHAVTAHINWSPAPRRACFVFDDPNLHSARYGYIDFAKMAEAASRHNYHVAFATVPRDAGHAADKAVELFRQHHGRLSLLIHGNDHVRNELSRDYDDREALGILAQALARIEALERRTGLKVARVVAAPHGACSESMMAQMLRARIEGACVSVGSLLRWNSLANRPAFGLQPVSFMAGGFPVVHRFRFTQGLLVARIAALLGQPIIPYGHHGDCADGLETLAEITEEVNRWGPAAWMDLESLLRASYRTMRDGELLHVQIWSRRTRISIPAGVMRAIVYAPAHAFSAGEALLVESVEGPQTFVPGVPFHVTPSTVLEVSIPPKDSVDLAGIRRPGYKLWAPVRRKLAIGRDRLLPIVRGTRLTAKHGLVRGGKRSNPQGLQEEHD